MSAYHYIARCSYGNDSVAMLQLMREHGLTDVAVVYSDTGWSSDAWRERVEQGEAWVRSIGWEPITLPSIGFERSALEHTEAGMFPTRLVKFCTQELKVRPFLKWVTQADPDRRALVCVGVRRAESHKRSTAHPFMPQHDNGRHVWHPIVEFTDADRDAMVAKTPLPLLPHRSDECAICINSNRADLRRASPEAIQRVAALEAAIGRPMFNPAKYAGAEGIHEVRRWAESERGKYRPPNGAAPEYPLLDRVLDAEPANCEDNWCGL